MAAPRRPWRLGCVGFSQADHDALRCCLSRLQPYLHAPWELVENPDRADLCLASLDTSPPITSDHPRVVGCAQRPREHAPGTLHRPLRVPQLLALLTETGQDLLASVTDAHVQSHASSSPLLALKAWPLDLAQASRTRLHVLAALTFSSADLSSLAARIGEAVDVVQQEVDALRREGLLVQATSLDGGSVTPPEPAWRSMVRGLGRRLGLSL
jgi:hypothetical protein